MGRFRDLGVVDLNNNRSKKSLEALFINQFDYFLFDCDGVLWCGEKLIPGAFDAVLQLQNLVKPVFRSYFPLVPKKFGYREKSFIF
jgi:hypothetical protein